MSRMIPCAGTCGCDVLDELMVTPPYTVLWMAGRCDPTPGAVQAAAYCRGCFKDEHGNTISAVPYPDVLAKAEQATAEKQRVAAQREEYRRQREHRRRMFELEQERDRKARIRATVSGKIAKRRSMQAA